MTAAKEQARFSIPDCLRNPTGAPHVTWKVSPAERVTPIYTLVIRATQAIVSDRASDLWINVTEVNSNVDS